MRCSASAFSGSAWTRASSLFACLAVSMALAAPPPVHAELISNFNNLGTYDLPTDTGAWLNYDVADTFGNTVILHVTAGADPLSDAPGFGELRLKSGDTFLDMYAIATSTSCHENTNGGNAWFTPAVALADHQNRYGIGNLLDGSWGTVNDTFISNPDYQPFIVYAYLDTPQTITEIVLGAYANRGDEHDVTFYVGHMTDLIDLAYNSGTGLSNEGLATGPPGTGSTTGTLGSGNGGQLAPIPEPSTLVALGGLLGMGLIGRWWRRRGC